MTRAPLACAALFLATAASAQETTYEKDAQGRIAAVTTAQGTTRYAYFEDGLVASVERPDGTKETYEHEDILAAQAEAEAYVELKSPPRQSAADAGHSGFAFTGHYFDGETGLYYAKARYYDPTVGRFITQDSYLGESTDPPSLHRYVYAMNRPTFFIDPSGHVVRQLVDREIDRDAERSHWLWAGTKAFFNEAGYQGLNVLSFGALGRQDRLADQSLAGTITDSEYHWKSAGNAALSGAQAAITVGTGGLVGASTRGAMAIGAASGVGSQALGDVTEVYGLETKTADEVRAADYAMSAGIGALGGYAGYKARVGHAPARQPSRPVQTVSVQEAFDAGGAFVVTEEGMAPAVASSVRGGSSVLDAPRRRFIPGERMPSGRIAGEGPGAALADGSALARSREIALGRDPHFKALAHETGAAHYRQWAEAGITRRSVRPGGSFGRAFHQAAEQAERIHFALDDIADPLSAASRGASGFHPGNFTNAELHYIANSPYLLSKTIFYRGSQVVESPFTR